MSATAERPPGPRLWRNRRVRLAVFQAGFAIALVAVAWLAYRTTADNLARRRIGVGFGFLSREAGFSLGEMLPLPVPDGRFGLFALSLVAAALVAAALKGLAGRLGSGGALAIGAALCLAVLLANRALNPGFESFAPDRSFLFAIATALANTVKVAALGIVLATVLGFLIGVARLAANPLVRGTATVYVEIFRNVPLLIQVFFWYFAVLRTLPGVRASIDVLGIAAINNRGIFLPRLVPGDAAATLVAIGLAAALLAALFVALRAPRLSLLRTGAIVLASGAAAVAGGALVLPDGFALEYPRLTGFNFSGGMVITPEYGALLLGLTLYTAAYIAEIVRSGLAGVGRGQTDAAEALGLDRAQTLRLVILPQALRIAVPPLISQYLSLTKDSSLGIAIGYPEIVSVTGQVINQTGQAIEMLVIALLIYMGLSLGVSAVLNWYNARIRWSLV